MEIEVKVQRIFPNEDMEIEATVTFWDKTNRPHNSAELTVFVPLEDYALSELKKIAIEKAYDFLAQIQATRST